MKLFKQRFDTNKISAKHWLKHTL